MNNSIRITGILASLSIIVLTLLFIITLLIFPPGDYLTSDEFIKNFNIAGLFPFIPSLLLVLANVPLFAALYFYADSQRKIFGLAGILFGTGYMVCSGINYFTQLGMVARNIAGEETGNITAFLMANPKSFTYALDSLGYGFLSLAFLAFSGIFNTRGFQSWIKTLFVIFAISGLLGTFGYVLNYRLLENMILISALPYLICVILLYIEFKRIKTTD